MKKLRNIIRKAISPAQFRNFIFAGRSVFTLENKESGNYITFKISQIKKQGKVVANQFGINCKVLGDSDAGYQFLGFLDIQKKTFKRWGSQSGNPSYVGYKTFAWILNNLGQLERFTDKDKLAIYHEGTCCKCGRPLTVPHSIDTGIGPDCYEKMIHASVKVLNDMGFWNDALTYEANVRIALVECPKIWNLVHLPDSIQLDPEFSAHKLLSSLNIF